MIIKKKKRYSLSESIRNDCSSNIPSLHYFIFFVTNSFFSLFFFFLIYLYIYIFFRRSKCTVKTLFVRVLIGEDYRWIRLFFYNMYNNKNCILYLTEKNYKAELCNDYLCKMPKRFNNYYCPHGEMSFRVFCTGSI